MASVVKGIMNAASNDITKVASDFKVLSHLYLEKPKGQSVRTPSLAPIHVRADERLPAHLKVQS